MRDRIDVFPLPEAPMSRTYLQCHIFTSYMRVCWCSPSSSCWIVVVGDGESVTIRASVPVPKDRDVSSYLRLALTAERVHLRIVEDNGLPAPKIIRRDSSLNTIDYTVLLSWDIYAVLWFPT